MSQSDHRPPPKQSAPGRRVRWMQLSLRTLLLAMVGVSIAMWWFLRPRPQETKFSGGYVLRAEVRSEQDTRSGTVTTLNHGRAEIVDQHGRVRIRGYYDSDLITGVWTHFDEHGRRVVQGRCVEGRRQGVWSGWHANGRRAFEVDFGKGMQIKKGPVLPYSSESEEDSWCGFGSPLQVVAVREGAARRWWDNGRLRSQGAYRLDRRQGEWTFWDRTGLRVELGHYEEGVRQGPWMRHDGPSGRDVACYYIDGERFPAVDTVAQRLAEWIRDGDAGERLQALRLARRIGPAGIPVIQSALGSPDPLLRRAALGVVAELGESAHALVGQLETMRPTDVAEESALLLARFSADANDRPRVLSEILDLAQDLPERERADFFNELMQLGEPIVDHLERVFEGANQRRRRLAFEAFASWATSWRLAIPGLDRENGFAAERTVALIRRAVDDQDPRIAKAASSVAEWLGPAGLAAGDPASAEREASD